MQRFVLTFHQLQIIEHVEEYGHVTNQTFRRLFDLDIYRFATSSAIFGLEASSRSWMRPGEVAAFAMGQVQPSIEVAGRQRDV